MTILSRKNFLLSIVSLLLIAVLFWTQSRFPALDEKSQMGARTHFSSLAFETHFPVTPEQSLIERIGSSALNWAITNWQGMTFGLLFGATFLCLLSAISFSSRSFRSPWLNSFYGTLMGAPLGVCANCATPVAMGMLRGGLPNGVALAGLSASPTLNVIVLTMSLSLLPLEMVLIKYAVLAVYLFLVLPFLVARWGTSRLGGGCDVPESHARSALEVVESSFGKQWLSSFAWLVKVSLPLMLLAGVLGVGVAEMVPSTDLSSIRFTLIGLFLFALFASFFPVPIAFDVIACAVLLSMGVAPGYVAAAFFALGVFSIYPAMVVARDMSKTLAVAMGVSIVLLAMVTGYLSQITVEHTQLEQKARLSFLMDEQKAKPLMREAARQCNHFSDLEQQTCFEAFIVNTLSTQFDEQACVFLEDAVAYRETCVDTFAYLSVLERAKEEESIELCDSLPTARQEQCVFAVQLDRAAKRQSLEPCYTLSDSRAQAYCQTELITLTAELYDASALCDTAAPIHKAKCLSQLNEQRTMSQLMAQNNLAACMGLPKAQSQQYCQGVVMVNRLEQGASTELCETIVGEFLKQRCYTFGRFFKALDSFSRDACQRLPDQELAKRCEWDWVQKRLDNKLSAIKKGEFKYVISEGAQGELDEGYRASKLSRAPAMAFRIDVNGDDFVLESAALMHSDNKTGRFRSIAADSIGIEHPSELSMLDLFEPFRYGRGVASEDINDDQWTDLAMAARDGVRIYKNIGGRFELQERLVLPGEKQPFVVAFADLNGDESQDLIVSYYGGENVIYFNANGRFSLANSQAIVHPNTNITMAVGFADPDRDGDVDMVWGGWSFGDLRHFKPVYSQNYYVDNQGLDAKGRVAFELAELVGPPGETLSALLSDLNRDGVEELVIANDRDTPDLIYQWQNGRFELVNMPHDGLPNVSSFNTMSLDSGDINNDAQLDYFSVDMTFAPGDGQTYCEQPGVIDRDACDRYLELDDALNKNHLASCSSLEDGAKHDCLNTHAIKLGLDSSDPDMCRKLAGVDHGAMRLCETLVSTLPIVEPLSTQGLLPGRQKNVLMLGTDERFEDHSAAMGIEESFWSWHARIADFDNDGWQDILVGNGYGFGQRGAELHSNVFFHGAQGDRFEKRAEDFGLQDWLNTPSFTVVDFDNDGDLDVISNRFAAAPGVFVNQTEGESVQFSLKNKASSALGSQLILHHESGQKQFRELKKSGGFLSFDSGVLSVGLGANNDPIKAVEVVWPNATSTLIESDFSSGRHYRITR